MFVKVSFNTGVENCARLDHCYDAPEYVNRFTNLESILYASAIVWKNADPDISSTVSRLWFGHNLSVLEFQSAFLSVLPRPLHYPTPHLRLLSICNLTNVGDDDVSIFSVLLGPNLRVTT